MLLEFFLCVWIDTWNTYTEHKLQTGGAGHKRLCERTISPNQRVNPCDLHFGIWSLGRKMPGCFVLWGTHLKKQVLWSMLVCVWKPPLTDPCWFSLERVGSSLANCFVWFVLSRDLRLNVGMGLWWHPWIFVGFHLSYFLVGWWSLSWSWAVSWRLFCAFSSSERCSTSVLSEK